ncbi:doublesex- and mab-3-related transcription factor C1-like [Arvicola amphibius]|uniref:doublesex- and mab-3-related transcription factor C1-like n=1 Tax=Arvicola amphibius TaxID=1047088 RepID=UPI001C09D647|nr:doublesex- and mab-3-related transcription factor C1-like [Arvicola amphibius]XP_041910262.1 doublesex- and mab-3-related transcription factor C1-like [Arvicola amphibius]XP_041910263.1 doublesex- and mab-3-related transcription factor C1-like [Arvicola amphibius]
MGDPGATLTSTPDPKAMQHKLNLLYPAPFLTPHAANVTGHRLLVSVMSGKPKVISCPSCIRLHSEHSLEEERNPRVGKDAKFVKASKWGRNIWKDGVSEAYVSCAWCFADGQESAVHRSEAMSHKVPQEGSSQGTHMPSQQREWAILPNVPVTLEQQPMISFSWAPRDPSFRPKRFSSVILQPSAPPGPLLLQPQVPNATKQDSVVAVLEWQRKLEAAKALLALKNSSQDPRDSASLQRHGSMPGDDGERGIQPPSSHLPPKPASSVSLSGHLECMSYLT